MLESTGIISSADEKTPTVSPKQGATGDKVTSVQLEEAKMEKKLKAAKSRLSKQNEELLELFSRLHRLHRHGAIVVIFQILRIKST